MSDATANDFAFSPSQTHRYIMDHTEQSHAFRGGDVAAWQAELRPRVSAMVGMDRLPPRPGVAGMNVRSLWKRETELGTIEKIIYTSEPACDVIAYMCMPAKPAATPVPVFVCLQGHSTGAHNSIGVERDDESVPFQAEGDRDFGLGCMRRGIAALCIEQRAFGLRREQHQGHRSHETCYDATMHALMLGRTMMGERIHDVDCGIDYLAARGDIDMAKLGVMGNSGGGTISLFAAALLPRIQYVMPSCYFCTFRDSVMSIYHCVDNFVPGLFTVAEMADVLGLFAPKPVVIVAGIEDNIFPIDATRRAFADLQRIYAAAGAADRVHLVEGQGGHRFYADDAWPHMLAELSRA